MIRTARPSTNGNHARAGGNLPQLDEAGGMEPDHSPREKREQVVLACMAHSVRALNLSVRMFSTEPHRTLFRSFDAHWNQYGAAPTATAVLSIIKSDPRIPPLFRDSVLEAARSVLKWIDHPVSPGVLHDLEMNVRLLREDVKRDLALLSLRETQWRIEQGHDLTELGTIRLADSWAGVDSGTRFCIMSAGDLIQAFPVLGEPVIHGIARRGEVMNLVSNSKIGKSWLLHFTLLGLASGRDWFGHRVSRRYRVLLLDNELKAKDIAYRLRVVAEAMGLEPADWHDRVKVIACRGRGIDVTHLWSIAEELKGTGAPEVVAVDSLYRFLPPGSNENDNAGMKDIMEAIIRFSDELDAMTVVVHHSTKGDQSERAVTDVGSGAGSVSRAADTHLILRSHKEDGCIVMEARTRTFVEPEPTVLRWGFPLWKVDGDLNPRELRSPRQEKADAADKAKAEEISDHIRKITEDGKEATQTAIMKVAHIGRDRLWKILGIAQRLGLIYPVEGSDPAHFRPFDPPMLEVPNDF